MSDRIITVKGIGNVTAKPDLIIITMMLENTDYSYSGAMQLASGVIDAIRTALISVGYKKDDLRTTDFNINTDYESYKDTKGNWKQKFNGYKCIHKLKLEFDFDMERLNKALSAIASSGAKPEFEINFSIKDKNAISNQLLQNAVKNASEKAVVLAAAAGLSLGAIQRIDYSWGELRLYSDTKMIEPLGCASDAVPAMDIEPEDIKVNDTVTVVWTIV